MQVIQDVIQDVIRPAVSDVIVTVLGGAVIQQTGLLPGDAGDYFSTPDSVANSITGDMEIIVKLRLTDWTPSGSSMIAAKWQFSIGNHRAFDFFVTTLGRLTFRVSPDGTANTAFESSVGTGFVNGSEHWLRVTFDSDNGASGSSVEFFTGSPGSWSKIGSTITKSQVSMFDSDAVVEIGTLDVGGFNPLTGDVSQLSVFDGIGGTLAYEFNADDWVSGATFTGSSTGEVWTINGNASIVPV